jgi:tetratricopeptide (TPR) repeat protein
MRRRIGWIGVVGLLLASAAGAQNHAGEAGGEAGTPSPPPALDPGYGTVHFEITTKVPEAQRYFDQGLRILYGFNYEDAERSFREAARRDPDCAMCQWGIAFSNGHNINVPLLPWRDSTSYVHAQRALELSKTASPRERALIEALAKRTTAGFPARPEDAAALDLAYADAMRQVAKSFPKDVNVLTLTADAVMVLTPWRWWSPEFKPLPTTLEAIGILDRAIQLDRKHIGANHLYIHAIEASAHPEKAVPSAEALIGQTPRSGHLVHMPSHIFENVGRFAEATELNRQAVKVDEAYFATPTAGMLYTPYLAHNRQFVSYCSMIEGRLGEAMTAGRAAASTVPLDMHAMMPGMDFFCVTPYAVEIKFGKWDDILGEPAPPPSLIYTTAYWHFARAMAHAAQKRPAEAAAERDSLEFWRDALAEGATEGFNSARALLDLAMATLDGSMARAAGDLPKAVERFQAAVQMEAQLQYNEPPDWLLFPRHDLGATLLQAGRPAEAEVVFRADLARHHDTGWALRGLEQALIAQKKTAAAARITTRFEKAWKNADTKISAAN